MDRNILWSIGLGAFLVSAAGVVSRSCERARLSSRHRTRRLVRPPLDQNLSLPRRSGTIRLRHLSGLRPSRRKLPDDFWGREGSMSNTFNVLAVMACVGAFVASGCAAGPSQITILATNDIHGGIEPSTLKDGTQEGGLAWISHTSLG
jgi:hypothetical protein